MKRPSSFHDIPEFLACRPFRLLIGLLILLLACVPPSPGESEGSDCEMPCVIKLFPKPATNESDGNRVTGTKLPPLDQQNWRRPQSAFKWIVMARDIKTPWDTFGRQGWMTDDAYVEPVDPGVSEFSPETEVFYLVFAVSALDAPSQYRAAWFHMPNGATASEEMVGTDALLMEMNEKAGYLEIFKPEGGWKPGRYLIKLYFESPGQDLYAPNAIGTMTFAITD